MKVLIAGIGAIGSHVCSNLVADNHGDWDITVLDFDRVEERNTRGTQLYTHDFIGQFKTEALQYLVYKQYEKKIDIFNGDIHKFLGVSTKQDLVIDCFDNYDARNTVQKNYKDFAEVLHIGFSDQMTFAIEWAEHYNVPTDITSGIDICEMQGAASFVKYVACLGSLVVQEWVYNKKKRDFIGSKFTLHEII